MQHCGRDVVSIVIAAASAFLRPSAPLGEPSVPGRCRRAAREPPACPGPAAELRRSAARRSPALPTGPCPAATSAATILFFSGVKGTRSALIMFPVARAAQSLVARGIQRTAVRQAHRKHEPTFHDKYGTMVLLGGATMFSAVWGYVLTQLNIEWGLSPVGRVTPREWRE